MQFQYPEDRDFFVTFLADGDEKRFELEFKDYFDFRHPAIKRWEFNKIKKRLLEELVLKYDGKCQFHFHPDCSKEGKFEPDHIIPLSTNELNKKLRHMVRTSNEKVLAQSFGSNNIENLILACKRCNAFKKHRLLKPNGSVSFLDKYPSSKETIALSSGNSVEVKKYFLTFNKWNGESVNSYGGKAVVDFNGKPEYAETAVLKLFQQNGWDGVWVDKKLYRTSILGNDPVKLPDDKQKIIDQIRSNISGFGGCWDLFLWKNDWILFIELKRSKKDRIQDSQKLWLETVHHRGGGEGFILVQWDFL